MDSFVGGLNPETPPMRPCFIMTWICWYGCQIFFYFTALAGIDYRAIWGFWYWF